MMASCRLGLQSHPADHIRGRCQGGGALLTLPSTPHTLGHEQPAQPQTPTREQTYKLQPNKTYTSSSDTYVGMGIIIVLCEKLD